MRRRKQAFQRSDRCFAPAFTLVELLVAAGITALMAGFVVVIVRNVSTTWSRAAGRLSTDAQARMVLDQLQLDLQGALFRDDGGVWLAADVVHPLTENATGLWRPASRHPKPASELSLQMATAQLADARFGTAGVWLRFFTTSRGAHVPGSPTSLSAPVAVSYRVVRRFVSTNPASQQTAYLLHRAEVRPSAVVARPGVVECGYDLAYAAYASGGAGNDGTVTGDPRSVLVLGNERNLDAVLAEHVIDFGVRCYVRDASEPGGLRLIFPADGAGRLSNVAEARLRSTLPSTTPSPQWGASQPFPDVIDIMLRVLTEEGASQLARLEEGVADTAVAPAKYRGSFDEWWWGIALENSQVYTRRVVLAPML